MEATELAMKWSGFGVAAIALCATCVFLAALLFDVLKGGK